MSTLVNVDVWIYTFDQKQAVLPLPTFEGMESQIVNKTLEASQPNSGKKTERGSWSWLVLAQEGWLES